jgi:transcriptional repressor NF-X1
MKEWGKKDPNFCNMIHEKLTELVKLAKESRQKSRSLSFDCMNRDKRQLVHEYAEHFGCESESYDAEPKRNVVATALKDKSWLPAISLLEFVQKQKKAPGPVLSSAVTKPVLVPMTSLSSSNKTNGSHLFPAADNDIGGKKIDWFD